MVATKESKFEVDLGALARLNLARLQILHRELLDEESPVKNAAHLRRKLAWHMQARDHGGLPETAVQYALEIARDSVQASCPGRARASTTSQKQRRYAIP